jgi:hypothetical protein
MAKRVRLSDDNGVTWYTLPGNSAELSTEAGEIEDTIFGQSFGSTQSGLLGWTINGNALYKGFAGYNAKILKTGASTVMTDEAMTLVSGKTYQITNALHRVLNRTVAVVVEDNNVAVSAANIESIDYLFGRVTFVSGYTPTGPITITGAWLATAVVGCANSYTLNQTAEAVDNTCMDTAQANAGHRTYEYGLKTVSLELQGVYKAANGFLAALIARTEMIIEVNPDGNGKSVARGYFKPVNTGQSGDVGDLEQETIQFNLSVPDVSNMQWPFHWIHAADTTLNMSVQKALAAWEASTLIDIQYLPDGTTGWRGDAVVTDLTLSGGLEDMNEFTVNVQGSGALVAVP